MVGIEGSSNINLDAKIGIVCHKGTWGLKVKEACNRAGLQNVTKIYTELSQIEEPFAFDLLFIAEDYYRDVTGGELLDSLLSSKKLKATTAVVMVGQQGETVVHNYDSIILLLEFLPEVFSQSLFQDVLRRMLTAQKLFIPVLSFVAAGRLAFAYKALTNLDKSKIDKPQILEYCKLQLNLAFELGRYKQVLDICNKPQLKNFDWAVWPRFKANYELGNLQYCQEYANKQEFRALPAGPMKLFWQLRVLIEQDNHKQALELLDSYPKQHMSLSMVRLVFALMSVSGNWQDAEQFIARKIRLAHEAPQMQATLINAQCSIYLYQYYAASCDKQRQDAIDSLKLHLASFSQHKMVFKFKFSIEVFKVYMQIAELGQDSNPHKVMELSEQLAEIEQHVTSPILHCRIAYAWHLLGNSERCFASLSKADCAFGYTPFGCERLLLAMMFKRILFGIYGDEQRSGVFKKLGALHFEEQRFKLSCKAYSRALDHKGAGEQTIQLLAKAMSSAGIEAFAGYQLSQITKASA